MSHPQYPRSARPREVSAIERLHHVAETTKEPEAAAGLREALRMVVALIEERGVTHRMHRMIDEQHDAP